MIPFCIGYDSLQRPPFLAAIFPNSLELDGADSITRECLAVPTRDGTQYGLYAVARPALSKPPPLTNTMPIGPEGVSSISRSTASSIRSICSSSVFVSVTAGSSVVDAILYLTLCKNLQELSVKMTGTLVSTVLVMILAYCISIWFYKRRSKPGMTKKVDLYVTDHCA